MVRLNSMAGGLRSKKHDDSDEEPASKSQASSDSEKEAKLSDNEKDITT